MRMRRLIVSASVFVLACVTLVTMQAQRQGAAAAAGSGQNATQTPAARGGGQRGGGGRADAPTVGPGNLVTGVWGTDPTPVDSRGWGWMTKSYATNYKRPFYNKAKELLFSDKQVTSYTISTFDTEFYCEVCKHYGFV